jgi:hypothetical protein
MLVIILNYHTIQKISISFSVSCRLHVVFPSVLLPWDVLTNILYLSLIPIHTTCRAHPTFVRVMMLIIYVRDNILFSSLLYNFLCCHVTLSLPVPLARIVLGFFFLRIYNPCYFLSRKFNILIYIQQNATFHSLFYLENALHVSGGTTTHHQERKQLYLQHLLFVTPLLLPAAIAAGSSNGGGTTWNM